MENNGKVGLALGGGGARGAAHIGILYELEKEKIPVDLIAGTSIGSIVGAFYACGFSLDRISEIFSKIGLGNPLYFRFLLNGIYSSKYIEKSFQKYLKDAKFSDVKIPFAAVSVDLDSGERSILREGLLRKAVTASSALPLQFTPAKMGRGRLVDGGLLANVPVDVVRDMGADIVIGIDLGSVPVPEEKLTKMSIFGRVFDVMIRKMTDDQLCHADAVIKPDIEQYPIMEFKYFDEIMQKGKEAAQEAMPLIKQAINGVK